MISGDRGPEVYDAPGSLYLTVCTQWTTPLHCFPYSLYCMISGDLVAKVCDFSFSPYCIIAGDPGPEVCHAPGRSTWQTPWDSAGWCGHHGQWDLLHAGQKDRPHGPIRLLRLHMCVWQGQWTVNRQQETFGQCWFYVGPTSNTMPFICVFDKFSQHAFKQHYVFAGIAPQQSRDAHSILVQCWASVADGGPTLNQH